MSLTRTALVSVVLALLGAPPSPAWADEPGAGKPAAEEPAIEHQLAQRHAAAPTAPAARGFWSRRPRGPRLEVSWRTFDLAEMANRRTRYHLFGADYFFLSGVIRAAAGLEGGFDDAPQGNFLVGTTLRGGVQWPSRITPSLDFVVGLGVLRLDVLHDNLVGFAYQVGFDAAVQYFVHSHFFLSFGIGWRRLGYRQPGSAQVQPAYVYNDTLSIRLGAGF